ncbi:hypothetical protein FACS1894185_6020 [Betaproteobacteria bacterium]|nr:hypothetical protein FACS1894185_6020 [Betaproteobacteria bacterium]
MTNHRYQITLQELDDSTSEKTADSPTRHLQFDFDNHDDIFTIIDSLRQHHGLADIPNTEIPALALGLKLFGKALIENKDNILLASIKPHFVEFMKTLKKRAKEIQ